MEIDPRYFRPAEVDALEGDSTKARKALGWKPAVTFKELAKMMVEHDLKLAAARAAAQGGRARCRQRRAEMTKDSRIYVAGHRGLVGSAVLRRLRAEGYTRLLTRTRAQLDLTSQAAVERFFKRERPEYVFLCAAKVGGILANASQPADFIRDNLLIQTLALDAALRHGVRKLLFLGSSCVYPKFAPQPIREDSLLTAALEPTNEWYAVAKIAGIKMAQAFRRQHGFNAISLMPTNLYGPGDNFDLASSHVIPALMRKFHEAAASNAPTRDRLGNRHAAPRIPPRGRPRRRLPLPDAPLRGRRNHQRRSRRGREHPRTGGVVPGDRRVSRRDRLRSLEAGRHAAEIAGRVARFARWDGGRRFLFATASSRPTPGSANTPLPPNAPEDANL